MGHLIIENFIEKLEVDVYPVTFLKYLLNKQKINKYFRNAEDEEFKKIANITREAKDCPTCKEKKKDGVLCRQHTSIHRVLNAKKIAIDKDTGVLFYKNEIFKMVDNNLVIIYCPHTKLLKGEITDERVRKINPMTLSNQKIELERYQEVKEFSSSLLLTSICKCWFNEEYSILTIPNEDTSDWAITSNR